MKQLTVLSDNKPGVMSRISELMGNNGVNLESISAETFADGAIIRLVTRDVESAKNALSALPYKVTESDILLVSLEDRAGELAKLSKLLEQANINVEYIYNLTKKDNRKIVVIHVDRMDEARKVLADYIIEDF